jgi:hypothetical protein
VRKNSLADQARFRKKKQYLRVVRLDSSPRLGSSHSTAKEMLLEGPRHSIRREFLTKGISPTERAGAGSSANTIVRNNDQIPSREGLIRLVAEIWRLGANREFCLRFFSATIRVFGIFLCVGFGCH